MTGVGVQGARPRVGGRAEQVRGKDKGADRVWGSFKGFGGKR